MKGSPAAATANTIVRGIQGFQRCPVELACNLFSDIASMFGGGQGSGHLSFSENCPCIAASESDFALGRNEGM